MGVTWELEDREATRIRRTARTMWGLGVAAIVGGTMAGLTFCRPPKPPTGRIGTALVCEQTARGVECMNR